MCVIVVSVTVNGLYNAQSIKNVKTGTLMHLQPPQQQLQNGLTHVMAELSAITQRKKERKRKKKVCHGEKKENENHNNVNNNYKSIN